MRISCADMEIWSGHRCDQHTIKVARKDTKFSKILFRIGCEHCSTSLTSIMAAKQWMLLRAGAAVLVVFEKKNSTNNELYKLLKELDVV